MRLFVLLAVVMDLPSRKIIGWAMSPWIKTNLVEQALNMPLMQRAPVPVMLIHSDLRVQFHAETCPPQSGAFGGLETPPRDKSRGGVICHGEVADGQVQGVFSRFIALTMNFKLI